MKYILVKLSHLYILKSCHIFSTSKFKLIVSGSRVVGNSSVTITNSDYSNRPDPIYYIFIFFSLHL